MAIPKRKGRGTRYTGRMNVELRGEEEEWLYRQVKMLAAQERTTIKEVILESVREQITKKLR